MGSPLEQQPGGEAERGAHGDDRNYAGLEAEQRGKGGHADDGRNPVEGTGAPFGPQHVVCEEHREIEDHPRHGGRDSGQRRGAPATPAPMKPTKATTMMSGPGVVSPSASPAIPNDENLFQEKRACSGVGVRSSISAWPKLACAPACPPPELNFPGVK